MNQWLLNLLLPFLLAVETAPPAKFVDKGACPRDNCKYGRWKAEQETPVFDKIDGKKFAAIKKGDSFAAVFGEAHSIPYEVRLTADDDKLKTGETVFLLTYLGQGFYRAWYKGKFVQVFESSTDKLTREKSKPLKSVWWVQVRLEDGRTGWIEGSRFLF